MTSSLYDFSLFLKRSPYDSKFLKMMVCKCHCCNHVERKKKKKVDSWSLKSTTLYNRVTILKGRVSGCWSNWFLTLMKHYKQLFPAMIVIILFVGCRGPLTQVRTIWTIKKKFYATFGNFARKRSYFQIFFQKFKFAEIFQNLKFLWVDLIQGFMWSI